MGRSFERHRAALSRVGVARFRAVHPAPDGRCNSVPDAHTRRDGRAPSTYTRLWLPAGTPLMRLILSIPLFLYLFIVANVLMLTPHASGSWLNVVLTEIPLPSRREMIVTVSDALIIAGVLSLYIETLKATRTSIVSIVDHGLSLFVFVFFLVELLIVPEVGNTTFLILTVCSLMDIVMGFTVTISTARRDLSVGI